MNERLYKVTEVAKMFEVTPATVRIWIRQGLIRAVKIGNGHYWRVPASAIEELSTSRWGSGDDND